MSFDRFQHAGGAVQTSLTGDITAGDSTCTIGDSTGWPDGSVGPFWIVLDAGIVGEEKCLVTARTGTTLSGLVRGQDSTTAAIHAAGAIVKHIFSALEADEANQVAAETVGAVTTKGDILAATGTHALARLGAGANGLPLVANSGLSTGVGYAALDPTGLASGAVTAAKMAANSVASANIIDGTIVTADLADASISTAKIINDAVTNPKIGDAAVDSLQLATGSVTSSKIGSQAVGVTAMAQAAVDQSSIVGGNGLPLSVNWAKGTLSGTTDGSGHLIVPHGASFIPSEVFLQGLTPTGTGGKSWGATVILSTDATNFTLAIRNAIDGTGLTSTAITGYFLCLA